MTYIGYMRNVRTEKIEVRLSDGEKDAITRAAQSIGAQPAAWARTILVQAAKGINAGGRPHRQAFSVNDWGTKERDEFAGVIDAEIARMERE